MPGCPKGSGEARRSQEQSGEGSGPQSLRRLEQCRPGQLLQEEWGQSAMLRAFAPLTLPETLRTPTRVLGGGVGFSPAVAGSGAQEWLWEVWGRMPSPSGPVSHSRKGGRKAPGVLKHCLSVPWPVSGCNSLLFFLLPCWDTVLPQQESSLAYMLCCCSCLNVRPRQHLRASPKALPSRLAADTLLPSW